MFEKETVFILGAGASWHYGYPTGEDLVKKIIEKTNSFLKDLERQSTSRLDGYGRPYAMIMDAHLPKFPLNNSREKIKENCRKLASRLTQTNTLVIDSFLSNQSAELQEIGKFIIAWVIFDCERDYFFGLKKYNNNNYNQNRCNETNQKNTGSLKYDRDDWCRFIIHKIVSGCQTKNAGAKKDNSKYLNDNNVHFITFNYDVSLEQSVLKGLQALSDYFTEEEIKEFLSKDRFIHMYGQVRENLYVENYWEKFVPENIEWDQMQSPNPDRIYQASQLIRTIEDVDKEDDKIFRLVQKIIRNAQKIYILGFGFDERNCDRLGIDSDLFKTSDPKDIAFTNFGIMVKSVWLFSGF